jgi:hypothetical protein
MSFGKWPKVEPSHNSEDFTVDKLQDLIDKHNYDDILGNIKKFSGLDHKEIALKLIEAKAEHSVADNLEKFSGLDKEVVLKLIAAGVGYFVADNLEKFSGLDHKEIALKLIEAKYGHEVVMNLEKFSGLDYKEIALKLIEAKAGGSVATRLDKFSGLDKEVALKLIEVGNGEHVAKKLEKFSGLDKEVALKLIAAGEVDSVANNLEKFSGLDHKEIALKLIEAKAGYSVAMKLEKFSGLDHKEIALKIIEAGEGSFVATRLDKFSGLDHKEIALKIIAAGVGYSVANNLEKFSGLDKEVALKLIEAGNGEHVVKKLEKFSGLDKEVALKLIEAGVGHSVANNLEKFSGLDHKEIALKLIEAGNGHQVVMNLEKFSGLDHKEIALKLIAAGNGDSVLAYFSIFSGLDHKEIALKLIEAGKGDYVAGRLEVFSDLDKEVALKLIEAENGDYVAKKLERFSGLDKEVALKLIESGYVGYAVANNLEKFSGLNHKEIALKLIEAGVGYAVANNLEKFSGLDHKEIALKLIATGNGDRVARGLEKFSGLDKEVALELIKSGDGDSVVDNLERFSGLDKEVTLKLIEAGNGYSVANNLEKFSDLDHKEIALKLIEFGEGDFVVPNLERFSGLDYKEIAFKLLFFGVSFDKNSNGFNFSPEDEKEITQYLEQCSANYLRNDEGVPIKDTLIKGNKLAEEDYKKLVDELKGANPQWKDNDNVSSPFIAGAEEFGYRKMFKFINRDDISRHDQLYSFSKVIEMYKNSDLEANEFFNNILDQVNKDESQYEDIGSSYHKLNVLAETLGSNIDGLLELIKENSQLFESVDFMPDLDKKTLFANWKNLKKFNDLSKVLEHKDLLESLNDLKKEGKEELSEYVKKLMFHPNIDTQKVMEFWKNPEQFLDVEEIHGRESHELKKPSNYVHIPNLDMTAEELRDALVEGYLDKIQDFQALEIEYKLSPKTELDVMNIVELTAKALGKRSEGIKGEAQSPNELFSVLNNIFKKNGLKIIDFLKLNSQEEINVYLNNNSELEKTIREELFGEKLGLKRKEEVSQIFRAKINKKSDPDGVIAGNDTVNCMPFGSGKNNVYTFNPGCALFTLQRRTEDGGWRTVAESVLTKDKDIKKNISEVLEQVSGVGSKLVDIVNSDVLQKQPSIITCDNVEVTPTFASEENDKIIETIYRDFFNEYVNKYQAKENLDNSKVIIGKGYNDSLNSLPSINNTFIPEAPLGYSDNLGATALSLDLNGNNLYNIKGRTIIENKIEKKQGNIELPKGIEELTYRDTLAVSYLEGKAYHDNESLMEYMHNMENGLIAKDINNSYKNRDNLSLKYVGDDKAVHGYLIAYEGIKDNESIIYIQDLASDSSVRAGGSLIKGLMEKYRVNYLDKENPIPIYAQFREQTSFKILNKQLDAFSKQLGKKLVMDEIGNYQSGGDTMHEVVIRVE